MKLSRRHKQLKRDIGNLRYFKFERDERRSVITNFGEYSPKGYFTPRFAESYFIPIALATTGITLTARYFRTMLDLTNNEILESSNTQATNIEGLFVLGAIGLYNIAIHMYLNRLKSRRILRTAEVSRNNVIYEDEPIEKEVEHLRSMASKCPISALIQPAIKY